MVFTMVGRRRLREPTVDPAVERIEELLSAAASRHPAGGWEGRARHVLTVCACITAHRSPSWIIFDTGDGIGWRRWPHDLPEEQMVRAPLEAGGHADPADVLAWLEGAAGVPWQSGDGDLAVPGALQRWIVAP